MPPIACRLRSRHRRSHSSESNRARNFGNNEFGRSHNGYSDEEESSSAVSSSSESLSTPNRKRRRRSSRGNSSIGALAHAIVTERKNVVLITGAGMSVASGIRPFRGKSNHHNQALWTQHIWKTATRETFRKDPLEWYNSFWLPSLSLPPSVRPNAAHKAVRWLLEQSLTGGKESLKIKMITQNIDGLLLPNPAHTIEAHGRLGLYKCIPDDDSDTDSESDDDDERDVHLGHRRKWNRQRVSERKRITSVGRQKSNNKRCPYQTTLSVSVDELEPASIRESLRQGHGSIPKLPLCPHCSNILAPQALLFDEGYHSHDFYEFQKMEEWLAQSEIIVFIGTSFAVRLPEVTLEHARAKGIPVYNFNTHDMLSPTSILDAYNIRGPAEETLPILVQDIAELQRNCNSRRSSTRLREKELHGS